MLSKTQYEYLSLDAMKKGIYDTTIKESPILARIPQVDVTGIALLYNIESTMATASWYLTGDTWVESAAVPIQRTTHLHILGGDADVDTFMNQTRSNVNDQMALAISQKAKAIAHEFEKQFIVGGTTSTPDGKSFDGIMELIAQNETTANQTTTDWDAPNNAHLYSCTTTTGALVLAYVDQLIDLVKPGRPDALISGRRTRRKMATLGRATGAGLLETHDTLGNPILMYGGIPFLVNDWVPENVADDGGDNIIDIASYTYGTTRQAGYDNSIIFAIKFGIDDLYVIQNGGVVTESLGTLETKDAVRTRLKWYCGLCNPNIYALAAAFNYNPDD